MDPTRWHRLKTLLAAALDQPPDARAAFVEAACEGDEELLNELRRLLAHHDDEDADAELDSPVLRWRREASERDVPSGFVGKRVGAYRLMRLLGRGGMGVVYLAERVDGQFEQQVAIKLVRSDYAVAEGMARFAVERQVLARLKHPHIARLLDGGVTEAGRPYVVMEYVEGRPITDYCAERELALRERLQLFQTVCDTVQYAHRNLVVHRDLKPSNILVSEEQGTSPAQVKLLDFGIAKLIEERASNPTVPLTRTGHRLMTPEYAAPEQVRGEPVTTATDVYQLGVLLYELLVGHRPFRLSERPPHEIERVILEEIPTRPSVAVQSTDDTERAGEPARRIRRLRGDLDNIVLRALHKDPDRRYASPEHLADDIRRHLKGLPVSARSDTLRYRASRFVRRHRTGVAASAAVVLALVAGLGLAVWQGRQAAAERDRAEGALERAERTLDFLTTMISAGGPREGDPDTPIGTVLDTAAARVGTALADKPEVARAVYTSLAGVYFELGRLEASEENARRALALFDVERGIDYARAAHALGRTLGFNDATEASIRHHEAALAALDGVSGAAAQRAAILNTYAHALTAAAREADAEAAYREALTLYQEVDDPDVLYTLNGLGVLYLYQGRYEEAVPLLRRAVDRMRHVRPGSYELGEALGNVAGAYAALGRIEEALDVRQEAVAILEEAVGEEHPSTVIQRTSYASDLLLDGRVEAAQREAQRAVDVAVRAFGVEHSYTAFAQNVAGQAYCAGENAAVGAPLLRTSLETRRAVLPEGHWLVANGESLLGACLAALGHVEEAQRFLEQGYQGLLRERSPEHQKTVEARERLHAFYRDTGRPARADALREGTTERVK